MFWQLAFAEMFGKDQILCFAGKAVDLMYVIVELLKCRNEKIADLMCGEFVYAGWQCAEIIHTGPAATKGMWIV